VRAAFFVFVLCDSWRKGAFFDFSIHHCVSLLFKSLLSSSLPGFEPAIVILLLVLKIPLYC
jgi:hypothetical protein